MTMCDAASSPIVHVTHVPLSMSRYFCHACNVCACSPRSEVVENLTLLQTKAMRERAEQRELRKYRFCLVRVRFPDAITLQVGPGC